MKNNKLRYLCNKFLKLKLKNIFIFCIIIIIKFITEGYSFANGDAHENSLTNSISSIGSKNLKNCESDEDCLNSGYMCDYSIGEKKKINITTIYKIATFDDVSKDYGNRICEAIMKGDSLRNIKLSCSVKVYDNVSEAINSIIQNNANYAILPINIVYAMQNNSKLYNQHNCIRIVSQLYDMKLIPITRATNAKIRSLADMENHVIASDSIDDIRDQFAQDYIKIKSIKENKNNIDRLRNNYDITSAVCLGRDDMGIILTHEKDRMLNTIFNMCKLKVLQAGLEQNGILSMANGNSYYSISDNNKWLVNRIDNWEEGIVSVKVGLTTSNQESIESIDKMRKIMQIIENKKSQKH